MDQYIKRFWGTNLCDVISFNDGFIRLRTTGDIIRFDGKYFTKDVRRTKCFQCPNLHLTKTLTSKLSFTTQRLLRNK